MEKVTIFKFHYKDHLVRALLLNGRGYVLGPDIMPLFGYKKQPLVDINQLLDEGVDKEFIYDVPVISLPGIVFLEFYPKTKKKKAQEVSDWVDTVLSTIEGTGGLPDDVRTEQWDEKSFKRYLEEEIEQEDKRLYSPSKERLKLKIAGETVAKAKIDTQKCSLPKALGGLISSAIFSEYDGNPDPLDALRTLHVITDEVMETIQEDWVNRLED